MKWLGNFEFGSHDMDYQGCAKASSVVEYMQEAARKHLEVAGPTSKEMKQNNSAFVVCRLTLANYASIYTDDKVLCETWACYSHGLSYPRCTKMYKNNRIAAELATVWTAVDTNTRRFVRMGEVLDRIAENDALSFEVTPRFKLPQNLNFSLVGEFSVGYMVCDENRHMNNVRYIDMFCEFIPGGLENKKITNVDISFVSEAPMGDILKVYATREVEDGKYYFKAIRSDGKVCTEAEFIVDRI